MTAVDVGNAGPWARVKRVDAEASRRMDVMRDAVTEATWPRLNKSKAMAYRRVTEGRE